MSYPMTMTIEISFRNTLGEYIDGYFKIKNVMQ